MDESLYCLDSCIFGGDRDSLVYCGQRPIKAANRKLELGQPGQNFDIIRVCFSCTHKRGQRPVDIEACLLSITQRQTGGR